MTDALVTIPVSLTVNQVIQFSKCLDQDAPMRCRKCVGCELNSSLLHNDSHEGKA